MNANLLTLASKLILASTTGDEKELQIVSENLAAELTKEHRDEPTSSVLRQDTVGFLKISDKEILKMPKSFRHTFRIEGKTICYRKRKRGKISCSYEARYRRHGYNLSVSATSLDDLIQKFISALHAAELGETATKIPTTFHEFAMYYFENFRKRKVGTQTYRVDLSRYKIHIKPHFGYIEMRRITPAQCQQLIDKILANGYERTAQDVYSLINSIFKTAIAHGILERNPLAIVQNVEHEIGRAHV